MALSISYGAGLWASEVCNLKVSNIDSDRMLIHVDEGSCKNTDQLSISIGFDYELTNTTAKVNGRYQ